MSMSRFPSSDSRSRRGAVFCVFGFAAAASASAGTAPVAKIDDRRLPVFELGGFCPPVVSCTLALRFGGMLSCREGGGAARSARRPVHCSRCARSRGAQAFLSFGCRAKSVPPWCRLGHRFYNMYDTMLVITLAVRELLFDPSTLHRDAPTDRSSRRLVQRQRTDDAPSKTSSRA